MQSYDRLHWKVGKQLRNAYMYKQWTVFGSDRDCITDCFDRVMCFEVILTTAKLSSSLSHSFISCSGSVSLSLSSPPSSSYRSILDLLICLLKSSDHLKHQVDHCLNFGGKLIDIFKTYSILLSIFLCLPQIARYDYHEFLNYFFQK